MGLSLPAMYHAVVEALQTVIEDPSRPVHTDYRVNRVWTQIRSVAQRQEDLRRAVTRGSGGGGGGAGGGGGGYRDVPTMCAAELIIQPHMLAGGAPRVVSEAQFATLLSSLSQCTRPRRVWSTKVHLSNSVAAPSQDPMVPPPPPPPSEPLCWHTLNEGLCRCRQTLKGYWPAS